MLTSSEVSKAPFKMFARICFFCLALLASPGLSEDLALPNINYAKNPKAEIDTSHGKIVLELFSDKAPATAHGFLAYVQSGHYINTIIHRIDKIRKIATAYKPSFQSLPATLLVTRSTTRVSE